MMLKEHQVEQISKKNMKQIGDDHGSTLSLLNVQNGHLLLPLSCVLSILDLRILSQFSAIPVTSFVDRRSLKNDVFFFKTSERHTATGLVNFVYHPT